MLDKSSTLLLKSLNDSCYRWAATNSGSLWILCPADILHFLLPTRRPHWPGGSASAALCNSAFGALGNT